MKIKAEVKSIDKLKDYFFVVPDYQREYVWQVDDQIEQFLIDIDDEYDPHAKQQTSYFIGSIIVVKNGEKYDAAFFKLVVTIDRFKRPFFPLL